MELAIIPVLWRFTHLADVNSQTAAVDENVHWLALRREIVVWSGTSESMLRRAKSDRTNPSVCLDARGNTRPNVTTVSIAWLEYFGGRPALFFDRLGASQFTSLPSVSEIQTVKLPRWRRPAS